jgi:hypothetical protein
MEPASSGLLGGVGWAVAGSLRHGFTPAGDVEPVEVAFADRLSVRGG